MSKEIKELIKLFDGAMSINDILYTDYALIDSIRRRTIEDNKKEAEQRMKQENNERLKRQPLPPGFNGQTRRF